MGNSKPHIRISIYRDFCYYHQLSIGNGHIVVEEEWPKVSTEVV